jgi:hypothetical protein
MKPLLVTLLALVLGSALAQRVPHFLWINTPLLTPGTVLEGVLDEGDGQNFKDGSRLEVYRLNGEAGMLIELRASSWVFDTYLTLYGPSGQLVAFNDDHGNTTDAAIIAVLPETGRYLLVVSGFSEIDLGAYTVSMAVLTPSGGGELDVPASVSGVLSLADPVFEGAHYHSYTFVIATPTAIIIDFSSGSFDSYLYLLNEQGGVVAENDDGPFGLDAQLDVELPAGRYELIVTTYGPGEVGPYTLSLTLP